jgi:SAM-dependent methyltransferase
MNSVSQVEMLLATYPRSRPKLSPNQQEGYVGHYRSNRAGKEGLSGVVAKLEAWMHHRVAAGVRDGNLLEIGAGNLNHVPYLPSGCTCDAVEPFEGTIYDCIFSIAVLEHLVDLPFTLARAGLLLRDGGTFRAGFPSEGGLLWGLGWRLTTGIEYRLKRGLDYGAIMRHEHLNTAAEVLSLLGYFYERVEISRFPCPLHHLSFYTTVIATKPRLDLCRRFGALESGPKGPNHG